MIDLFVPTAFVVARDFSQVLCTLFMTFNFLPTRQYKHTYIMLIIFLPEQQLSDDKGVTTNIMYIICANFA